MNILPYKYKWGRLQGWVGESGFIDYISFGIKGKIKRPSEFLVYIQVVFDGGFQVFFSFFMGGEVVYILVIHYIKTLRIRCK